MTLASMTSTMMNQSIHNRTVAPDQLMPSKFDLAGCRRQMHYRHFPFPGRPPTVTGPSLHEAADIFVEFDLILYYVEFVVYQPLNMRHIGFPVLSVQALSHRQSTFRPSCGVWQTIRRLNINLFEIFLKQKLN
jgi:hypothetical protein